MQVEIVQPNIVFDIASLMLYGTQATPIRLKILLDRLFSVLQHDEVLQVLHGFGWTYEDYARGYILQDRNGRVLDKWAIASRDEEQIIIQQFLRFGETKSIAQEIILQDTKERQDYLYRHSPKTDSDIKKFLERSSLQTHNFARSFDSRHGMLPVSRPAHTPSTSGSRIMSPTRIPNFSPGSSRERESSRPMVIPKQSTSPMSTSPLNRLSTMQPFDYRRDPIGTALAAGDKSHLPTSIPSASASLSIPTRPIPSIPSIPSVLPEVRPIVHMQTQPQDLSTTGNSHKIKKEEPTNFSTQSCPPSSGIPRATNLSLSSLPHMPPTMSSHYADRKVKHLRKSANPMKRQWQPSASFGSSTLISPSGKKRVLCTACNKTFCDKGALKIHYSAVHLKEMHTCTVAGCNMVFSSRRSRNRHSANPNPKLHRPTKQKIPDGATIIDDGKYASGILASRGTIAQRLFAHPNPNSDHPPAITPPSLTGGPLVADSIPPSSASNDSLSHISNDSTDQAYYIDHNNRITLLPPEKRMRLDRDDDDDDDINLEDDGQISVDSDKTEEMPSSRPEHDIAMSSGSSRKRKSAMPTRCKQTDDDLLYAVSDENNDEMLRARICHPQTPPISFPQPRFDDEPSDCEDMPLNLTDPQPRKDAVNDADEEALEKDLQGERNAKTDDFDYNKNRVSENENTLTENNSFKDIEENAIRKMDHLAQIGLQASKPDSVDSGVVPDRAGSGVAFFGQIAMPLAQPMFPDADLNNSRPHSRNTDNGRSSDIESNASFSSSASRDHSPNHSPSSYERDRFDIPIDNENPRQCVACGKLFQNQFGVKTHYQNVHLKLMHTCTVEGCNAAFPSKRSRDRHSSNLNLHRKLLSTCGVDGESDGMLNSAQSLRDEFLSKIYDGNHYGGRIRENGNTHDKKENEDNDSLPSSSSPRPSSVGSPDKHTSVAESLTLRSFLSTPPMAIRDVDPNYNTKDDQETMINGGLTEVSPQPDPEGAVDCHICKERFRDNLVLKEHFEKVHPKEMFRCTIPGCEKVFSTRKSRNRHSQNDNLHRHLMGGTNGDSL